MTAPFFWTTKMLYLRLSEDRYNFNLFDLAIDSQIYQNLVASVLYVAYVAQFEFSASEFFQGSIVAVFFILGDIFRSMSFRYGPGGPINALVGTQTIYQTVLNAIFFDQPLTAFQYYGISAGIVATIIISSGDELLESMGCIAKTSNKKLQDGDNSEANEKPLLKAA